MSGREDRILQFLPRGREARLASQLLGRHGVTCVDCQDFDQLMKEAERHDSGALVVSGPLDAHDAERLLGLARRQPRWSDLPVILLAPEGQRSQDLVETLYGEVNLAVLYTPLEPTVLVTAVSAALRSRRRQFQLRELHRSLEHRVAEGTSDVRRLARALTLAERRERQRIARVLHEGIQQQLFGLQMQIEIAQNDLVDDAPARSGERLERVVKLLDETITATRTLTTELAPPVLRDRGLVAALDWLARHMHDNHGLAVDVIAERPGPEVEEDVLDLLLALARELLFNVVKHSGVLRAQLFVSTEGDRCRLSVADEGAGFGSGARPFYRDDGGFGLVDAADRVRMVGGSLDIESAPGHGTRVYVAVPLARA